MRASGLCLRPRLKRRRARQWTRLINCKGRGSTWARRERGWTAAATHVLRRELEELVEVNTAVRELAEGALLAARRFVSHGNYK
jgi:hypothetical protein